MEAGSHHSVALVSSSMRCAASTQFPCWIMACFPFFFFDMKTDTTNFLPIVMLGRRYYEYVLLNHDDLQKYAVFTYMHGRGNLLIVNHSTITRIHAWFCRKLNSPLNSS